jgi:hypothetical protein
MANAMTIQNDKFDHKQAAAFDVAHAKESEYYRNLINYWVFTWSEKFEADGYDEDTARLLAKSLLESVITIAHLPIEERRERVDAYERQRTAKEWAKISKKEVTI